MPTSEEVESIELITGHVADAIMWSRRSQSFAQANGHKSAATKLKLVSNNQEPRDPAARLVALAKRLRSKAADLDRYADALKSEAAAQDLREAAKLSRMLAANIILHVELAKSEDRDK